MDGYYAFMLVATAFVLMMTVPALALFYGGMSRSKSVLNMMMMSYVAAAIVGILYVAVGWSMGFGGDGTLFANPLELLWLDGVSTGDYVFVMFQMTFAIITAALISGAVADRMKFSAWVLFVPLWAVIVYFPMAHMVFSCTDDSLICGRIGAQDYAGGTAVHINAGCRGAGAGAAARQADRLAEGADASAQPDAHHARRGPAVDGLVRLQRRVDRLRRRPGDPVPARDRPHLRDHHARHDGRDPRLAARRAGAAQEGHLARCGLGHRRRPRRDHPAAGAVNLSGAVAIGAIAGGVCAWAVGLKYKLGYDDSLDVVGVHLVGGIIGTVLIGVFSTSEGAGGVDGLVYGGGFGSLGDQVLGVLVAVAYSGVLTTVIALVVKYTIGLRLDEEDEVAGIDLAAHGESAYDLHTGTSGGRSSVLAPAAAPVSSEGANA